MDDTMNVAVKGGPCGETMLDFINQTYAGGEELHSDWGRVRIYSREWAFPPAVGSLMDS